MRMKVFLSTMWDLYFFWKFDCKYKMTTGEFEKAIKTDLGFLFMKVNKFLICGSR